MSKSDTLHLQPTTALPSFGKAFKSRCTVQVVVRRRLGAGAVQLFVVSPVVVVVGGPVVASSRVAGLCPVTRRLTWTPTLEGSSLASSCTNSYGLCPRRALLIRPPGRKCTVDIHLVTAVLAEVAVGQQVAVTFLTTCLFFKCQSLDAGVAANVVIDRLRTRQSHALQRRTRRAHPMECEKSHYNTCHRFRTSTVPSSARSLSIGDC